LVTRHWGSVWVALPVAMLGGILLGLLLERGLFRFFYAREHLDQVLLTFALILLFEETRSLIVGNNFYSVPVPAMLAFSVNVLLLSLVITGLIVDASSNDTALY
jgi:branched-chain amino acid transport system permease protein